MKKNTNNRSGSPTKTHGVRRETGTQLTARKAKRKPKASKRNSLVTEAVEQKFKDNPKVLRIIRILLALDELAWKLEKKKSK